MKNIFNSLAFIENNLVYLLNNQQEVVDFANKDPIELVKGKTGIKLEELDSQLKRLDENVENVSDLDKQLQDLDSQEKNLLSLVGNRLVDYSRMLGLIDINSLNDEQKIIYDGTILIIQELQKDIEAYKEGDKNREFDAYNTMEFKELEDFHKMQFLLFREEENRIKGEKGPFYQFIKENMIEGNIIIRENFLDPNYLNGIKALYEHGVNIATINRLVRGDILFKNNLIANYDRINEVLSILNKAFGSLDNIFISILMFEDENVLKALKNPEIVKALKYLKDNGVELDNFTIGSFTIEKARNQKYLDVFLLLKNKNIRFMADLLSIDMAMDRQFVSTVILLNENGVDMGSLLGVLFGEKHKSKKYINAIIKLKSNGIKIDKGLVEKLTLDKGKSIAYIDGLIRLNENCESLDFSNGLVIENLSLSKGSSEKYIDGVIRLIRLGYKIGHNLFEEMSFEIGINSNYFDSLERLVGFGLEIDEYSYPFEEFTLEKAENEEYMNMLESLSVKGIKITLHLINNLSMFRGTDTEYLRVFFEIYPKLNGWYRSVASVDFYYLTQGINDKKRLLNAAIEMPDSLFIIFDKIVNRESSRKALIIASENDPWSGLRVINKHEEEKSLIPFLKKMALSSIEGAEREITEKGIKDRLTALKIAQSVDQLHTFPELRYRIINNLSLGNLYDLIYSGREEIFQSSYNGILDRFLGKLKKEGKDIYDVVVTDKNFEGFGTFIEASVSYNRFNDVLGTIKGNERRAELLSKFLEHIINNAKLQDGVALAEIMQQIDNRELLITLEGLLKESYESGNENIQTLLGLIGKSYAEKAIDPWFKNLPERFKLPNREKISSHELFDSAGRNVQQYFFYNDEDGKGSFYNFMSKYKNDSNWKVQEKESHVVISSYNPKTKKKIYIYANKPQYDGGNKSKGNGIEDIKNSMKDFDPPLESIVIVHRGHSYHAQKTIEHIPPIAKMVFLGSCGGYQNFESVLEKAEDSHIIATKGTGTRHVNDPLFKIVNDAILSGKDIVWKDIWEKTDRKVKWNKNWKDYIRPDQNFGAMFIYAYKKLMKEQMKNENT